MRAAVSPLSDFIRCGTEARAALADLPGNIRHLVETIGSVVDLWDFFKMLFRRWYLTVPLLALSAGAAYYAAQGVEPTYTASSSGVFLEPAVNLPPEELAPNPWTVAGVSTTASAIVDSVVDPVTKSMVVAQGYSGEYTVLLASRSVLFTVYAPAPSIPEAEATLEHVINTMKDDLSAKQAAYNVPADQRILIQITSGTSIVTTRDGLQRVVLAVGGLGAVLTAAIVVVVDSILRRRKRRPTARHEGTLGAGLPWLDEVDPGREMLRVSMVGDEEREEREDLGDDASTGDAIAAEEAADADVPATEDGARRESEDHEERDGDRRDGRPRRALRVGTHGASEADDGDRQPADDGAPARREADEV